MPKKFNYKAPSIIALTLAGTALTTHHAHASEKTQDQTPNKNTLNDDNALKESEQIKSDVSKPTTNVSGTQAYQDPTIIKAQDESNNQNYDATLDNLHNDSTNVENSNAQSTSTQTQVDSNSNAKQESTIADKTKETVTQDDKLQTKAHTMDIKGTTQQENEDTDKSVASSNNDKQSTFAQDESDTNNSAYSDVDAPQFVQNNISDDQSSNVKLNDIHSNNITQSNTYKVNKDQHSASAKVEDAVQKPTAQQTAVNADDIKAKQSTTSAASVKSVDSAQKPTAQQKTVNADDNKAKQATTPIESVKAID
ncbi:hypothetical protein RPL90_07345, partial [Staphylococcus kloosii]|nr:hypothetical protein [Staphylococcus kloosii]